MLVIVGPSPAADNRINSDPKYDNQQNRRRIEACCFDMAAIFFSADLWKTQKSAEVFLLIRTPERY